MGAVDFIFLKITYKVPVQKLKKKKNMRSFAEVTPISESNKYYVITVTTEHVCV